MGHQSVDMVKKVYSRKGKNRVRLPYVEYGLADGRLPGQERLEAILGAERVAEVYAAADAEGDPTAQRPALRAPTGEMRRPVPPVPEQRSAAFRATEFPHTPKL
jgi:hypothetical protein